MEIVRTVKDLRAKTRQWRNENQSISFVPTMGALHKGHISLVHNAKSIADKVVVSIFINPTQFNEKNDFSCYPKEEKKDIEMLEKAGANLVFIPTADEMYPKGFSSSVTVSGVSDCLCGGSRAGHFEGVATVVTKLLLQVLPDVAVFGEKDYQQLQVIKRLLQDLDVPVKIVGSPTMREKDGLAMSSRNARLNEKQRHAATNIYAVLNSIAIDASNGLDIEKACEHGKKALIDSGFSYVDYLEIRDAETLEIRKKTIDKQARIFCAAQIGSVRLIDNIAVSF